MQNDKRRASYFTFILLLAIATLLGSWGSFYFFTQKLERDTSESYNEKQFEHVQGISRNINDIFLIIERELETVASSAEVRSGNGRDALPILATSYRKLENHVSDIAVIDSQGRFLATHKTGLKRTGISALNRNSTSETIRTKAPSLAGPFLTLVQSKAISLDVPVFRYESVESSESGRTVTGKVFVGTVSCLVEVDKWIENYLKPFDAQINSSTWIINNNSQVVANTNSALIGEKWLDIEDGSFKDPTPGIPDRSGDLQFLNTVLGGKSGKFQGKLGSLGTEDQIVAYAPINITNTRWSVISTAPKQAVLKPFYNNMRNFWLVVSLFALVVVFITSYSLVIENKKLAIEKDLRQKLQQSEKKYRLLVESSNDGILLTSPDSVIKLANKKFQEMFGYREDDLLGVQIGSILTEKQRDTVEKEMQRRSKGISSSYELSIKDKSDKKLTLIVSGSPIFNREGQHLGNLDVFTDITDKKRAEEEVRRRIKRLETIYKVSKQLTSILEMDKLLPSLVKHIQATFGYYNVNILLYEESSGDLVFTAGCGGFKSPPPIGHRVKPPSGIVGRCFGQRKPVLVNDVDKDPEFVPFEGLSETRSEIAIPLLSRGSIIGVLDVENATINAFDEEDTITLQVLAEQIGVAVENAQLYERLRKSLEDERKSQAFFANIILTSPLSTFVTDSEGTCVLVNQSGLELLGKESSIEQVIGSFNLLKHPPFAMTEASSEISEALTGKVVQFVFEMPVSKPVTKNGSATLKNKNSDSLSLRVTAFPLMEADKASNIVAMFEDLTEKKQLEEALRHAQKMESIGTLAGGIAHDFNNILGGVLGYASLLKNKIEKSSPIYRYAEIIETSSRRAAELTQQLLAFARKGKYQIQVLNVNKLVKEALEILGSTLGSGINIKLKLAENLPNIEGDSNQIIQAIVNICINARDAMPLGGELLISTYEFRDTQQLTRKHPEVRSGGYIVLSLKDTGIGMSQDVQERIFEPFFTTKREKKGTGLGLSMVYGIVRSHSGFLDVESQVDKGTNFRIYLPISQKRLQPVKQQIFPSQRSGQETILVAEDELVLRDLITEMLRGDGYKVVTARNGKEAVDIYKVRGRDIDLVILDMIMPEIGGQEAFRQLKSINPAIKVLLSSGYSQDGDAQEIIEEGVIGFIQKPYAVDQLLNKVRVAIDQV